MNEYPLATAASSDSAVLTASPSSRDNGIGRIDSGVTDGVMAFTMDGIGQLQDRHGPSSPMSQYSSSVDVLQRAYLHAAVPEVANHGLMGNAHRNMTNIYEMTTFGMTASAATQQFGKWRR